jgi:hypothetical protein
LDGTNAVMDFFAFGDLPFSLNELPIQFLIKNGLRKILPNVRYIGSMPNNTLEEYEAFKILCPLQDGSVICDCPKPTYEKVYTEALKFYKKQISEKINKKTEEKITTAFRFTGQESVPIKSDIE